MSTIKGTGPGEAGTAAIGKPRVLGSYVVMRCLTSLLLLISDNDFRETLPMQFLALAVPPEAG